MERAPVLAEAASRRGGGPPRALRAAGKMAGRGRGGYTVHGRASCGRCARKSYGKPAPCPTCRMHYQRFSAALRSSRASGARSGGLGRSASVAAPGRCAAGAGPSRSCGRQWRAAGATEVKAHSRGAPCRYPLPGTVRAPANSAGPRQRLARGRPAFEDRRRPGTRPTTIILEPERLRARCLKRLGVSSISAVRI
ncbi:unnamed protein product [Amoebophrya sp. A120]|nr:unnamed protein product [Amoebophrya sp. A120]|eukprot:GSA120T00002988001.1